MTWIGQASATLARGPAAKRARLGDGTTVTVPDQAQGLRDVNAKLVLVPQFSELTALIEHQYQGRRIRVKNTSGGSWAAGTQLAPVAASALSAIISGTATSSPQAGANVVITVAGAFEVGMLVYVTTTDASGTFTDVAIVTAVGGGTITVDNLWYNHTLPTVASDVAYLATKASATGNLAEWVTTAAIANGAYGEAFDCVEVTGLATNTFAFGDAVYLSTTAGTFSNVAPTVNGLNFVQWVGVVKVSHATLGTVKFFPGLKRVITFAGGLPTGGSSTTLLHGPASGPTWSAVSLTADVSGRLPFANLTQGSAQSVLGVSGNATADFAAIAAPAANTVLRQSGTSIGWGAIDLSSTNAVTNRLPYANFNQGSALSVLGVTGNATADHASIVAAADGQVMRRNGSAVAFGAVDISSANAVSGALALGNGGTGIVGQQASGRSTAQTAAVATVAQVTVGGADASFEVSANVLTTAIAGSTSFNVVVDYTDEGNTARHLYIQLNKDAATGMTQTVLVADGVMAYSGLPQRIRAKAGTTITIKTLGTFNTVTYNVEGFINKVP